MIRGSFLNGTNQVQDYDFSKLIESIRTEGVVSGMQVTTNSVGTGYGFINVTRGTQTRLMLVEIQTAEVISTSGTKKVWIDIDQTKVDNPNSNPIDGSTIARVQTGASYPASGHFIKLASITGGTITDEREYSNILSLFRTGMSAWRMFYTNGSGSEVLLPFGSSGQVLTSQGASAAPVWGSPALDINGQSTISPVLADFIPFYDVSGTVNGKMLLSTLQALLFPGIDVIGTTRLRDAASGTVTYTHALGRTPKIIKTFAKLREDTNFRSDGIYNNLTGSPTVKTVYQLTSTTSGLSTTNAVDTVGSSASGQTGVISNLTSTTFDVVWTKVGNSTGTIDLIFEIE